MSQTWSTLIVDALSHAYPVPYTETVSSPARILPSPGKDFYDLYDQERSFTLSMLNETIYLANYSKHVFCADDLHRHVVRLIDLY